MSELLEVIGRAESLLLKKNEQIAELSQLLYEAARRLAQTGDIELAKKINEAFLRS
jgi:hypothetical protein